MTFDEIEWQLKRLSGIEKKILKQEIVYLPKIIQFNEKIEFLFYAVNNNRNVLMVFCNNRILIIRENRFEEFKYNEIKTKYFEDFERYPTTDKLIIINKNLEYEISKISFKFRKEIQFLLNNTIKNNETDSLTEIDTNSELPENLIIKREKWYNRKEDLWSLKTFLLFPLLIYGIYKTKIISKEVKIILFVLLLILLYLSSRQDSSTTHENYSNNQDSINNQNNGEYFDFNAGRAGRGYFHRRY